MSAMRHLLHRLGQGGVAQVGPVHIGAQVFAAHSPAGLPIHLDAQAFTQALPTTNRLTQVSLRRVATLYKPLPRLFSKTVEIDTEFFHAQILPTGND